MTDKERLIEILNTKIHRKNGVPLEVVIADYLLDNDVLPVTRCKDCKHAKAPETPPYMLKRPDILKCGCSGAFCSGRLVYPTDYCSYGVQK